ncbi:MAG: type II toxin-antitoxin system VapC family toxin [Bacteroidetes bacterium]|nr:type II toxin-antitoxin system VapC family toxin [Bacteroidota bacterium]
MAELTALLDTSILIDYFRKTDKSKSALFELSNNYNSFAVSNITYFEIMCGISAKQKDFWMIFFSEVNVLPFSNEMAIVSANIYQSLKSKSKLIQAPDIFIASCAIVSSLPLATLNIKHFSRVENVKIVDIE